MTTVEAVKTKTKCTPRCWKAKCKTCRCSCEGQNHGIERQPSLFTGTKPPNQDAIHPKYRNAPAPIDAEKEKDYRDGQKVVCTIEIEDKGQDFIELDVLENGVLLGDSVMFSHGRLSLLGIGSDDGMDYHSATEVMQARAGALELEGLTIYLKNTGEKDPLPWKAQTLKYAVVKVKDAVKPDRFIKEHV